MKSVVEGNEIYIIAGGFLIFTLFSYLFQKIAKKSIRLIVIAVGTFGLALAFSGNDLVNFIGVPMAAYHSWEAWTLAGSGDPTAFTMEVLDKKMPAEPFLLFIAGAIMVVTLWFSKKPKQLPKPRLVFPDKVKPTRSLDPICCHAGS
ncbi:MAG: inorganic phosphate transporter, partial [Bacteroidota bacterium]